MILVVLGIAALLFGKIGTKITRMAGQGTVYRDNMGDEQFRKGIEEWLGLTFPDSVEWEKSEYDGWLDASFQCLLTVPQNEVDGMFPPDESKWQENSRELLPPCFDDWLKGKSLESFKVFQGSIKSSGNAILTVAVDNPPDAEGDQRVWVYINCYDF